jgi:BirA family biotin operon repressor/biotin-[acetyl-CoA-carboxylase] ligase
MGIVTALSPTLVEQYIREEEIPLRNLSFPVETVLAVFRYGAIATTSIQRHDRLERGMDHARALIREYEESERSFPSGLVIIANQLTSGRGRFQRFWHAPEGGLWMTVVLVNTLLPVSSGLYTLATGTAAGEAIREEYPEARVKWVNDVHANGRKICGILTETMRGPVSGEEYILLGIGVNVNNEEFPPELEKQAVSLKQLLDREVDVNRLAALILAKLAWNIGLLHYEEKRLLAESDAASLSDPDEFASLLGDRKHLLVDNWLSLSDTLGRRVLFGYDVQREPMFEGVAEGLSRAGSLLIRLPDGNLVSQNSGEIVYLD